MEWGLIKVLVGCSDGDLEVTELRSGVEEWWFGSVGVGKAALSN